MNLGWLADFILLPGYKGVRNPTRLLFDVTAVGAESLQHGTGNRPSIIQPLAASGGCVRFLHASPGRV